MYLQRLPRFFSRLPFTRRLLVLLGLVAAVLFMRSNSSSIKSSEDLHKRDTAFVNKESPKSVPNVIINVPKMDSMHRIVHLDLKGAPPKLDYYDKLFPKLREWGATGLLIEYEDMFPYSGRLAPLARRDAYSTKEVGEILQLAKTNRLIVIPLVQTFGHTEFVLKHEEFKHLREVPAHVNNLNPAMNESLDMIEDMVNQVLALHPVVQYVHIGGDEVQYLGRSPESIELMKKNDLDRHGLFLYHITGVLRRIAKKHPRVKPIMWDDMLRGISFEQLKAYKLGELVQPMVWEYRPDVEKHLTLKLWRKYATVFSSVWIATAFKGATGPVQYVVDINYHLKNHENWMVLLANVANQTLSMTFVGVALTGWQRYDHMRPLCELLPVGLPSLAVCLHCLLNDGVFTDRGRRTVSTQLGCGGPVQLLPPQSLGEPVVRCDFPGSDIYASFSELRVTRSLIRQYTKNTPEDRALSEVLEGRLIALLDSLPPALLEVFRETDVKEILDSTFLLPLSPVPTLSRKLHSQIAARYPWMGAD